MILIRESIQLRNPLFELFISFRDSFNKLEQWVLNLSKILLHWFSVFQGARHAPCVNGRSKTKRVLKTRNIQCDGFHFDYYIIGKFFGFILSLFDGL